MIRIRKDLTKTWQSQVQATKTQVTVLSPYITKNATLGSLAQAPAKIYTLFQVRDFASGASDINVLTSLLEARHEVYELKGLHAKVIMDEDGFTTLGSQNLTGRGAKKNLELSVCFSDLKHELTCDEVRSTVEGWIASADPMLITLERIERMKKRVEVVKQAYKKFDRIAQEQQDAADDDDTLLDRSKPDIAQTTRQQADEKNWVEISKKVKQASSSPAVLQGVVSVYEDRTPFLRFTGQNLLHWPRKGAADESLVPGKRYLCILDEREFGWARVARTQITRIAQHITLGKIIPGLPEVEVELWTQEMLQEKTPTGTNLVAVLLINDQLVCTVPMIYLLGKPQIGAAISARRSAVKEVHAPVKDTKAVMKWLGENQRKFKLAISKHIASNNDAPAHSKTYGTDAEDFVGSHLTTVNMGVVFKGQNPILILTTQP